MVTILLMWWEVDGAGQLRQGVALWMEAGLLAGSGSSFSFVKKWKIEEKA